MAKENKEVLIKIATLITEVKGINKRLDGINGTVQEYNRESPMYKNKVDDIEDCLKTLKPQITGLKVKLYTGMALASIISMLLGAGILKLITFLAGG